MDRAQELRRCLNSIAACTTQPTEIIVSDDGQNRAETQEVCAGFPLVRYFPGPCRGLCANRNAAIDHATADFVSLLDDDVVVPPDFISLAFAIVAKLPAQTLVTGTAIDAGRPVIPNSPSFLGFFGRAPNGDFRNINLICNLLPRSAFQEEKFDEIMRYGYEDMDLCTRLLARGYVVRHEPKLVTTHLPPPRSAAVNRERKALAERARFYATVKRYLMYERSAVRLLAYVVVAPVHRALHAGKAGKWSEVPVALTDMCFAIRNSFRERAQQRRRQPTSAR
jgi:glycosyltransferase involved in cell wall biosynthesis